MIIIYNERNNWNDKKIHKTNDELDWEIKERKGYIDWNNRYIKCLKKGIVSFDKPTWEGEGLKSDIEEDLYTVANSIKEKAMSEYEYRQFNDGELSIEQLRGVFKRADYTDKDIAEELIECLEKQTGAI